MLFFFAGPWTRATPDNVEFRPPPKAIGASAHSRTESALLQHKHQLSQKRARAKDAVESAQKDMDGRADSGRVLGTQQTQRERRSGNARTS